MEMQPLTVVPDVISAALAEVAAARAAGVIDDAAYRAAVHTGAKAMRKVAKRAVGRADNRLEPVTIKQTRGPTLEFNGTLLGEYETGRMDNGGWFEGELWQTEGGSYVAVAYLRFAHRDDDEGGRAVIVPPSDDELARQAEVMNAFDWSPRARTMAREQLGWDLMQVVD